MVIIENCDDCELTGRILVVAISTRPETPRPWHHIQVHHSDSLDPHTGLSEPCWAKCDFWVDLDVARIKRSMGDMPDDLMALIVDAYDRL